MSGPTPPLIRGKGKGLHRWWIALCTVPGCRSVHNTYTDELNEAVYNLLEEGWGVTEDGHWYCTEHHFLEEVVP